ncbi:MAG: hypothetical protein IJJ40_05950 [Clostridia bacterium]|nr:hypothetical protein [Clostridia bacterium]
MKTTWGEETSLRVGDVIQCWADYKGNAKYIYVISRNYSNAVTAHRGTHNCSDCGSNINWQPWTSATSLPTKSGHYYLCGNVVAPQANVGENQNVVLCLNGYSVRAAGTRLYSTFYDGSSLHIHDCVGTGKMYSKYQGNLDGIFGGILYARRGNISINGGTYEAPEQEIPGNGGVIYVADNLKLSVRNAKIIGGNVGKNGGAIFSSNGIVSIYDSTVKSGKAGGGKGDAIYLTSKSKLTIGGKVVIDGSNNNLYLSSSSVTLDEKEPLTEGSHIGVTTISATGKVTTNYINGSGCEKYFTSDTPDRVVTVSGAIFMSKINPTEAHDSHTCKECDEGVTWTPLTNPNELPTESGHYYLCGDISVNAQITIAADKDIVICLNGHNIKSTARRIYAVSGANSKLTVMDCKNKGKLFNSTTKDVYNSDSYNGRIIVVGANATLNLFGVTIESPSYKSPLISGGAINVNKGGTANIEDSTIIGGPVGKNGGAVNAYGSLSLKNTNITSGKADGNGDALYIGSDATFTIEGKVNITGGSKQVYINKDGQITLGGPLTSGSHIGIACGDNIVKITSNYYTDAEKYFENQRDNGKIVKQGDAVCFKVAAPAHNENHACVDCGNSVEWQPWLDSSSVPTTSGHYYLCYDVTVSGQKTVAAGEDVVLCLNGHKIKSTARRVYLVNGADARLTLCDCVGGGKIYNSTTTNTYGTDGQGRIILVGSGGTLNAYNVQIISPKYSSDINGGVLSVSSNGTINLKDCYIKGDKVGKNGGAIYLGPNAKLSLCDVDIVSGTADKGDAIYASGSAKITLSGNVNIEDGKSQVYLDGSLMKFDGELAGNGFTVTTTHIEGQISENYVAGAENIIKSADENLTVKVNSGALYLIDESAPPPTPAHEAHTCKECGESVTWTAWTSTETLPTDSGHYYLTDDVTVNGQKTVGAGKDVVICLNGHDITSTARRVYLLNGTGAKLTLMDCKESGTVSNSVKTDVYAKDGHGRIILVSANTTLNIFDITVKSPEFKSGVNGGTIGINKNGTCNIEDATVIGGPIGHNTESNDGGKGGAIFVSTSATLNLKNVNIVSGKADVNGDAIYAGSGAKVNVSGKVKIDNETNQVYLNGALIHFDGALTDGSGMLVNTSSADGKVSDNYVSGAENYIQSGKSGYVVNAKDGALYLEEDSGEPVVTGHTHLCKQCGSDVTFTEWTETTSLPKTSGHYYLTEDVVTNAQTSIGKDQDVTICLNGHNISCTARRPFGVTGENSVLTLCDCAGGGIINNTAKGDNYTSNDNGRIILVSKTATLNVYDVTLKAPTYKSANVYGGVISISNGGTTNISGAKIVGGEIGGNGGAITVIGGGKLTLCDTEIVAGKSDKGTDGIYCAKNAIIEVSGNIKITGDATHIYLNGTYIHFADVLTEGSEFNVDTADADGKVSDNYAEGAESYIKSAKTGFSVVYKDGAIYLESSKGKMMSIKTANEQKNANLSILSPALNLLKETK